MATISVNTRQGNYPIHIGEDLLASEQLLTYCQQFARHWVVISDESVAPLYGEALMQYFSLHDIDSMMLLVPAGEASKTREMKQHLEDQMLASGYGRDCGVIALGGGVVSDLAGFIAATYCRGVASIYLPTTLLAMVDAAVGGKTGVNTPWGKNLVGCFYQPKAVLMDLNTLKTLSTDQLLEGMVETIKHGLIDDAEFFDWLNVLLPITDANQIDWQTLVAKSVAIKAKVVAADELEAGQRQILNFGHTMAHAFEQYSDYQISHGQAVLAGLQLAVSLSEQTGNLTEEAAKKVQAFLANIQFTKPIDISLQAVDELLNYCHFDKKAIDHQPRFVLLTNIGVIKQDRGVYSFPVDEQIVKQVLQRFLVSQGCV